ncbi:MAG: hypothetical protein M1836_005106 [Candelina mexicana]|nr:MAG: hypothetical protein M1836_005106 [Candelina mexicana]
MSYDPYYGGGYQPPQDGYQQQPGYDAPPPQHGYGHDQYGAPPQHGGPSPYQPQAAYPPPNPYQQNPPSHQYQPGAVPSAIGPADRDPYYSNSRPHSSHGGYNQQVVAPPQGGYGPYPTGPGPAPTGAAEGYYGPGGRHGQGDRYDDKDRYDDRGHSGGPPGGAGEGERGLGATLVGAAGGGFLGHELGGGALGTIGGAIAGVVGANALEKKHKEYSPTPL